MTARACHPSLLPPAAAACCLHPMSSIATRARHKGGKEAQVAIREATQAQSPLMGRRSERPSATYAAATCSRMASRPQPTSTFSPAVSRTQCCGRSATKSDPVAPCRASSWRNCCSNAALRSDRTAAICASWRGASPTYAWGQGRKQGRLRAGASLGRHAGRRSAILCVQAHAAHPYAPVADGRRPSGCAPGPPSCWAARPWPAGVGAGAGEAGRAITHEGWREPSGRPEPRQRASTPPSLPPSLASPAPDPPLSPPAAAQGVPPCRPARCRCRSARPAGPGTRQT